MGSVAIPSSGTTLRSYSYAYNPSISRRHSVATALPRVETKPSPLSMDSRYYRPASPRRVAAPGRASTGTFSDPYNDPYYASRGGQTSPRTSGERIIIPSSSSSSHHSYNYPASSTSSRSIYSGRPRRSTLTESDDRSRTNASSLAPHDLPLRTHGVNVIHSSHDRPSSPLARSWDSRGETYITHSNASASQPKAAHKRIYSVDDNHSARLIAERDLVEPRRKDSGGYGSTTSGDRTYHRNKPLIRNAELKDADYSYTDPASMYRDTEPAWRRPRAGSLERGQRPSSMIMDRTGPRSSARELGPPPSTRGFDKINSGLGRSGSLRDSAVPVRPPSRDRSRERSREADPYAAPSRSSSTRHPATAIHQDHHQAHRRDTYPEEYETRERERERTREPENRRQSISSRYEDPDVATRGFGIRPTGDPRQSRDDVLDRQPIWDAPDQGRPITNDYPPPYYPPADDRRVPEPRMPDARIPDSRMMDPRVSDPRISDPRIATRDREPVPYIDSRDRDSDRETRERRKERDYDRRDKDVDERGHHHVPGVATTVVGAAASYGAAEALKHRERDRDSDRERERRRERDPDRDRRDSRRVEERQPVQPPSAAPTATAYNPADEADRRARERRHEDDDRERRHRRRHSSDESNEERPRHYVDKDREAVRDRDNRRQESEPALDPDEEYRRRIQQEQERARGPVRDRDSSDSDREKERRRRKDDRERVISDDIPHRAPPAASMAVEPPHSRYNDRSNSVLDTGLTSEPDTLSSPADSRPERSVQIVAPPKEDEPKPKGILRKPTEKFPEHPDPIREGVAPHKSQMKGKDIPVDARWTKIDRRLVNPQALEEAKERFEERMDCVIVLRVLTKAEIQKFADRTTQIREEREDDRDHRDHRDHRDRERRNHRSRRDDDDSDRRYDDESGEEDDRPRVKMIEN